MRNLHCPSPNLESIDSNILSWWLSPEVQIARLNYLKMKCDQGDMIVEFLSNLLHYLAFKVAEFIND